MAHASKGRTVIYITNVDPDIRECLEQIRKYEDRTLSYLLRPLLREFVNRYPDSVKHPSADPESKRVL